MDGPSLQDRFNARMGHLLGPDFPSDIGLSVSGGGDSMAMLYLTQNWTRSYGVRLWVVTIDHGLRPEAADEARLVAGESRQLGWPHATLRWSWDGKGNLMETAREARLALIDAWRGDLRHILMAHTADDVAEGFLMRLRRGSGVEGLAAMSDKRLITLRPDQRATLTADDRSGQRFPPATGRGRDGFFVVRPLLHETRQALRGYLKVMQGRWVDDPSNENTAFERVRMRRLVATLRDAGIPPEALSDTAHRMAQARTTLTARAMAVANDCVRPNWSTGDLRINRDALAKVEPDTQLRLLAEALQWVASDPMRPRLSALQALLDRVMSGGAGTLHGCEVVADKTDIQVVREYKAVANQKITLQHRAIWDRRWSVQAPDLRGLTLRALGPDGWAQIPDKPALGPVFRSARALPAIFSGDRLVACAGLGFGPEGAFRLRPVAGLLQHSQD